MTPQELKNSILQLAIQGKLVEQREEEGNAEDLYAQIQAEKQRLIAEKKIKKQKPLPAITDEEKPFDIPESWKWVRLREICSKIVDGDHNPPAGVEYQTNFLMLSAQNINQDRLVNLNNVRYLSEDIFNAVNQRTNVADGDILFTIVGTLGRSCVYRGGYNVTFQRSVSVIKTIIHNYLFKYSLDAPFIQQFMVKNASGTAQKGFYLKQLEKLLIPLPPLAEQKRIVAKIEELLPHIDRYEQAWSKLEQFNARFPEDMKKSLLQYAIQGKLVEQRPEEGNAEDLYAQIQAEKQRLIAEKKIKKQKPLPEITDEEKPFDIPKSWKWVRLGEIVHIENGDRSKKYPGATDYVDFGIPFFGAKDMGDRNLLFDNVRYISENKFDDLGNGKLQDKDFVCLLRGSVGKVAIFEKNSKHKTGFICAQMVILRCVDLSISNYLYHILKSAYYTGLVESKTTGTAVRQLPAKELAHILIPLPPLAEQKRIVEKLEQLLPLCERLK